MVKVIFVRTMIAILVRLVVVCVKDFMFSIVPDMSVLNSYVIG